MRSKAPRMLGLAAGVLGAAAVCHADTISITGDMANSTEGLGNFNGSLSYSPLEGNLGSLMITLTNTSSPGNGGFLTGFVFNIASSDSGAYSMQFMGPPNFVGSRGSNAGPFGQDFDGGSSTFDGPRPARFTGGGDPSLGLGVGETGVWNFRIVADDAANLSASDFLLGGGEEFNFIVRFRGFDDNGSDMVPAMVENGFVIPLPSAAALGGVAMLGLAGRRRRHA